MLHSPGHWTARLWGAGISPMETTQGQTPAGHEALGRYLNDHLLGATGGLELFRRVTRSHRGTAEAAELEQLTGEIEQDRTSLLEIMRALGVPVRSYEVWLGWTAEKVGRLKPNGGLLRRVPLSSVIELEAMTLGVAGKAAGWRVLRAVADRDGRLDAGQLDILLERAARQQETLEGLRMAAAAEVF